MIKIIAILVFLLPIVNDATGCQVLMLDNSVTAVTIAELIRAGWTGNPNDGAEALYSLAC